MELYGTAESLPRRIPIGMGPLRIIFEEGALRWLCWEGTELVRGIQIVARDRDWGTPAHRLVHLEIDRCRTFIRLRFGGAFVLNGVQLLCAGEISAEKEGRIRFDAEIIPEADVETGRTGLVVLYPLIGTVGRKVSIVHSDGTRTRAAFPENVVSEPIWSGIRAVQHEPIPGLVLTCRMEGDDFECEDHRNWTDASFKFYSPSIARPYPYRLAAGLPLRQSVELFVSKRASVPARHRREVAELDIGDTVVGSIPAIGAMVEPESIADAELHAASLSRANLRSLSIRIDDDDSNALDFAARADQLAHRFGVMLHLELLFEDWREAVDHALDVLTRLRDVNVCPAELVIHVRSELLGPDRSTRLEERETLFQKLADSVPGVRLGGGTLGSFYQLAKHWTPSPLQSFVSFATSSTVHAADDQSVMETLESLPDLIRSAIALAGGRPIRINAANIGLDINPDGELIANPERRRVALSRDDPRQAARFGAAWGLGYLAQATKGGIESVVLGKVAGTSGLLDPAGVSRPLFSVIAAVGACAGAPVLAVRNSMPQLVQALACRVGHGLQIWAANLTPDPLTLRVTTGSRVVQLEALVPLKGPGSGEVSRLGAFSIGCASISR